MQLRRVKYLSRILACVTGCLLAIAFGRLAVSDLRVGRDEFATPYSKSHGQFTPGTEIHATILLNLLRGDWLTRMAASQENALIVILGLVAGGLAWLRPTYAALLAFLI